MLFISHRFDEVFALCDAVTVMRDGGYIATDAHRRRRPSTSSCGRWSAAMSRSCSPSRPAEIGGRRARGRGPHPRRRLPRHQLHGAVRRDRRPGRARRRRPERGRPGGLRRRPRTTPAPCASTAGRCRRATRGSRWRAASRSSPRTAASRGSCSTRASRATSRSPIRSRWRRLGLLCGAAGERVRRDLGQPARGEDPRRSTPRPCTLSGGNQQKVVLGKWLATEPEGADRRRADPRHRRRHQGRGAPAALRTRRQGVAVLMISSELPEVLGMADRVLVMREGRLTGEFPRARRPPRPSCSPPPPRRRAPYDRHPSRPSRPSRSLTAARRPSCSRRSSGRARLASWSR